MSRMFVGDNLVLRVNTYVSLTGYDMYVKYKKPSGENDLWIGSKDPDDDNVIMCNVVFDEAGTWKIQAYLEDGEGKPLHGMWAEIKVYNPIW